ncbi:Aclacinomycin methylesterase RdmC [BD1-7 clade bacterium]|uniref:Aclacinomycin methylesterase RdmC n=1 Tax=BD1-7 clade bacterium TaxID=2029982 RepID=A0A5S9PIQ1_9GAMM|nr:Aclacinomycin methylesterase RdmC [BD1-7 clade bacterium]CAA0103713.1 Aclacinomycin methylesterase RdmC [BD1-7 clade bacterium]
MTHTCNYRSEQTVSANGIELAYDQFGDDDAPAILLIMGLGTQMIAWPEQLCCLLADSGFRVIRFDNRDVGLSSRTPGPVATLPKLWMAYQFGMGTAQSPYTLEDMAEDAIQLLDALDIEKSHVVGASMGGMIAQIMAINYPQRVLTLTSVMSTSGRRGLPGPNLKIIYHLWRKAISDDSKAFERTCNVLQSISSPRYPLEGEALYALVKASCKRSTDQTGYPRQLAAVLCADSRVDSLKQLTVPALVIHGDKDPMLPVAAGKDTAACIPEAKLMVFEGMGHDLPEPLLAEFSQAISAHARA